MKLIKPVLLSAVLTILAFASVTYVSCKKDPCKGVSCLNGGSCSGGSCYCPSGYTGNDCGTLATTVVTYNNNTFTPVVMVSATGTATVSPGNSITYTGTYGDSLTVVATTSDVGGLVITWNNLSTVFPATGRTTMDIDVSSNYFYLEVQNTDLNYAVTSEYVNFGTADSTTDYVNVPNNRSYYGIGYYRAVPGCTTVLDDSNGGSEIAHLIFSSTINQGLYIVYH